jgi:hypothetical protein
VILKTKKTLNRVLFCTVALSFGAWADDGKLTIYMAGNPIASETYSIVKSDGKIALTGSGQADLGSLKINIEKFAVTTDDKYQPVSAEAKAMMGQMKMEDTVEFAGGKAKNQLTTGQGTNPKEDDVHADTLVVNANLPLFAWSTLALRVKLDTAEPQKFNAYILGQTEVPVTVVSLGKESVEFADRAVELNHFTLDFPPGASSQPIHVNVWLNEARKLIKITVPSQNVEAYQEGFERKAPPPKPADAK